MPKPYSLDLRERVFRYVDEGHSCRAAAAHFQVSISFVVNLAKAFRVRGSLAPKPSGGRRHAKLEPHRAFLLEKARREGRHHHAGAGGRTGRRHLRECRSRLAFALAHPHWLSLQKKLCGPASTIGPTSSRRARNGSRRASRSCGLSPTGSRRHSTTAPACCRIIYGL
jgi:transposase